MSLSVPLPARLPTRWDSLQFRTKAVLLQIRRAGLNQIQPVCRYERSPDLQTAAIVAESITPLWTSYDVDEQALIVGKIQNLRQAAQAIDGIVVPAQGVFSFWAQVGQPTRGRGYVDGRELRQGCVIPSVGGGLCQLSNALYSAALDAGLEMIERHAHSQVIPGSLAECDRDATVFWNYLDLRWRSPVPLRIEVTLTDETLIVRYRGEFSSPEVSPLDTSDRAYLTHSHSCHTCGVSDCFRNRPQRLLNQSVTYLVDEYWPEFDHYLQAQRRSGDRLVIPLDGNRWHKANYAWTLDGFATVMQAQTVTFERAIASRRLPAQGKSRQQTLLKFDRKLAEVYADRLGKVGYDSLHWVVAQNLLPFLWQMGALGGRKFEVLMTRLPMAVLHDRLDRVAQRYPESATLTDFRGNPELLVAEQQALQVADRIITPHSEIAALFPEKTVVLDWQIPPSNSPMPGSAILFAGSTLGRKGAYEMRQVAENLQLRLRVLGSSLEGDRFWQGLDLEPVATRPLDGVGLVVLPAHIEHRPRLLLRAIAAGIPVIASSACGVDGYAGVTTISAGDILALQRAIEQWQDQQSNQ